MPTENVQLWPDGRLLEAIQADDRGAFEHIYTRYWSKLYLSAYNILRDRQACEDIVQEVLVRLWLKRGELAIDSLEAYLHCSVRYQVFKVIRSGKTRESIFSEHEKLSVENEAESVLAETDINRRLEQGIAELPIKCRQIFLLSRKEHLTTNEIALQLGIASKTVENQLTIALRRLRVTLGNFLLWITILLAGW